MVVVHPDVEFPDDIAGRLKEYVLEEVNIKSIVTYNDDLEYASLHAEPNYSVLGKCLGKSMGVFAKGVKDMSQENILAFKKAGEITIATHCLKSADIKIAGDFKRPDNTTEKEVDIAVDGDVWVILDLRPDESLVEAGVAREVVNRIQKLRKKAALEFTDVVEVYFKSLDKDESVANKILDSQESYIRDALGSYFLPSSVMPPDVVTNAEESFHEENFHGIPKMAFVIILERLTLVFNSDALLALYEGNTKFVNGLQTYLRSRDHHNLKREFPHGEKIRVDCIENLLPVEIVSWEHVFFMVRDFFLSIKTS